jgi:Leucine Rich Repeat (LRR) protein
MPHTIQDYEGAATDMVLAFNARDAAALARLNAHYGRAFTFDDVAADIWRRVYAFRQRSSRVPVNYLDPAEARTLVAHDAGFGSWSALTHAAATNGAPLPAFGIDASTNRIAPRRYLRDRDWDELIAAMQDLRVTALDAHGLMTDAVLSRIARLDHVTALDLAGSRELTDAGLRHLQHMPQLQTLNLSGAKLTDQGLQVLRHLEHLRRFEMTWQRGVTDAGIANLEACDWLEHVDLMGSPAGDGAIAALRDKRELHYFSSGQLVTDTGLRFLHQFPRMKTHTVRGAHLLVDGPFTNNGLASLAGLDGVTELDLFWHVTGVTTDAFAHLSHLPNLESLGADGSLADDVAMRHIAALPRLRNLRVQGTVATDAGFEALSGSNTIERIWGRECPNLGSRGFAALSKMPALRALGVSCEKVDHDALAMLPQFPALRELTPIHVHDAGFAHIGRCERLERLTCMYCRDTTDIATEHVAGLRLTHYYAGLTQITDRSLEILGRMAALEEIEFYECMRITDAGLPSLARLPRLREIRISGLPGVTLDGTRAFRPQVRVQYST